MTKEYDFYCKTKNENRIRRDWEYGNIGMVTSIRVEGHLVGLKMMKEICDKSENKI